MPLDLQNLQDESATCHIGYGAAGEINLVYRPNAITEKMIRQLRILEDEENRDFDANMAALNGLIIRLVVSWDLTNKGVPIPLTDDGLSDVPIKIRTDVLNAIFAESRLGEPQGTSTAKKSHGTSARKARTS